MPTTKTMQAANATSNPKGETLLFGGHVNGGIKGSVSKAEEIGAQVMQIFLGSPQSWQDAFPLDRDVDLFVLQVAEKKLGPVFVHGNYLVNLASNDPTNLEKSIHKLRHTLFLSDRIGAQALIFHPGAAGQTSKPEALKKVVASIKEVLKGYKGDTKLALEVCAGAGTTIGDSFSDLSTIIEHLNGDERIVVCLDTCHLYAAGYDVASASGLKATIAEFEKEVGFGRLVAIHANDSKTPLGARKDRHENIGKGCIGEDGFRRMLQHKALRHVPWILEVPGFAEKGPDRENLEILRRLAS
ncbi:MAG: deoxyribonuclease IV [Candidatus Melainabacteria bacterium]|nr:deoxyribonuclease IV [Candidatus Melainabacteria bacterium]